MPNTPQLIAEYSLGADNALLLTVTIGDAQLGVSAVWIDDRLFDKGDFTRRPIGLGKELFDSQLRIKSLVSDVNAATNHTSVTYILEGGPSVRKDILQQEVANNGDSVIYRSIYALLKTT